MQSWQSMSGQLCVYVTSSIFLPTTLWLYALNVCFQLRVRANAAQRRAATSTRHILSIPLTRVKAASDRARQLQNFVIRRVSALPVSSWKPLACKTTDLGTPECYGLSLRPSGSGVAHTIGPLGISPGVWNNAPDPSSVIITGIEGRKPTNRSSSMSTTMTPPPSSC